MVSQILIHKIVNYLNKEIKSCYIRSNRPEVFCNKDVLRNFTKFTGKHLCQRLWQTCFSVNFAKFLRTTFLQNTSGGCFCTVNSKRITHPFQRKDFYVDCIYIAYLDFYWKLPLFMKDPFTFYTAQKWSIPLGIFFNKSGQIRSLFSHTYWRNP